MDVADWLRALGLEQYTAAFQDNDVDSNILPSLTADDLKDLGINSVGHRRVLLEAIATLRSASQDGMDNPSGSMAELRPLSVMFCDLVGFTALSSRLGLEDLREVVRTYQAHVATTIRRFDGFITRYVGDGVLIYFGWPEARETDAERAVHAGLAVASSISRIPLAGEQLHVHIGIATGPVIVGEVVGAGDSDTPVAFGQTPNLAARLQALARPNQVIIDAATRRQIGDLFECQDLGMVALKGLPALVPAWQVLREGNLESRFQALHGSTMTPLIGREQELDILLRHWEQAAAGTGQIVLLTGEPGIGKSRLLVELEHQLTTERHASWRYFCSPLHLSSALHPVIARWERDAGFARDDTVEQRLQKLEAILAPDALSATDFALVADMLGVPTNGRYPKPDLGLQQKKERTFAILNSRLASLARRQPVLMLVEDAHWADPSSIELFELVASQIRDLPILLVVSFRPEFVTPWADRADVDLITLTRLDRKQSAALAAQVTAQPVLTPTVLQRIIAQTDGVPLFIEELTKAMLETAPGSSQALAVPSTLQASLMARLDRLPAAKQVAQIAAVIGREFSHGLMAAAVDSSDIQLGRGLEDLVAAGLVFQRGLPPDTTYSFKHALVQDAAYGMITRDRRRVLHGRVAATMETSLPENVAGRSQLLAHHWSEAGEPRHAVRWWLHGARQGLAKLAPDEALVQTERGLRQLQNLPEDEWRLQTEVELQLVAANALMVTHGHAAPRTGAALERAVALCERLPSVDLRTNAQFAFWSHLMLRGDLRGALNLANDMMSAQEERDDQRRRLAGLRAKGTVQFLFGEFNESVDCLEQFITLWNDQQTPQSLGLAHDPGCISAHCYRSYGLVFAGRIAEARNHVAAAMEGARASGHHLIVAQAMFTEASLEYHIGAFQAAKPLLQQTLAYSAEHRVVYFKMFAATYLSTIEGSEGDIEQALRRVGEELDFVRASGTYAYMPGFLAREAELLTLAGRVNEALSRFAEALVLVEQTSARWDEARIRCRFAKTLIADGRPLAAETELRRALDVAQGQGAPLLKLQVVCDYVPVLVQIGHVAEARTLLRQCLTSPRQDETTPSLVRARELLRQLSADFP